MNSLRRAATVVGLMIATSCTATSGTASNAALATDQDQPVESALVELPPAGDLAVVDGAPAVALIDDDGQLAVIRGDVDVDTWFKWTAFPSPDRTAAVLTLGPHIDGIGPERPVTWVGLPGGAQLGEQTMRTDSELTAMFLDGTFAGFTSRAGDPVDDAIAGGRDTSRIEIISLDDGTVFVQELDGNFVPEAFSSRLNADGIPAQVFLLEYVPADVPRFYRVRVLSTETGDVSLPLNLRNKSQQVDERMAGFSRSQVVAEEHGLLFTLYRGTIDGTPDGEPYAFVHTLDFADGVWCLEVDPRLGLDKVPGSLAVGGDRLYVASANGWVGSYQIPSITDPDRSPSMEWVIETGARSNDAPVMTADEEAVYVVDPTRPGFLSRVSPSGQVLSPTRMAGVAQAFDWKDGALHAVGDGWATFDLESRPGFIGEIDHLIVE